MATALLEEDEFAGRDPMGLRVVSEKTETEEQAFKKYLKLLFVFVPILGLSLAIATYVTAKNVGGETIMQVKFHFLRQYQLGYVFLAAWLIGLARAAVALLANSARAAARLDRPDQHVYKIMDASGSLKSAPYVLMATTGAVGRFNRTQRAAYNMDESLPCFLVNTLLASSVFGPVTLLPLLFYCYGRLSFTVKYKKSLKERGAGFLPSMIGEKWIEGLVLLSAIKSLTGL